MRKLLKKLALILFLGLFVSPAVLLAQEDKKVEDYIPTENIERQNSKKRRNSPKRKSMDLIIKNTADGLLYGNPCMIEETYNMGFQYMVQTKGLPGSISGFPLFWNNFKTWNKLIFTRSPFWKMTLSKRVRDCRRQSGDFVG